MPIKQVKSAFRRRSHCNYALIAVLALSAGCASEQPVDFPSLSVGGKSSAPGTVEGRFRDLDAVVRYSCSKLDMTVVELIQADGGDWAYRIRTINDEPAWLIVSSDTGFDDPRALLKIDLSAKIGRFGNRAKEGEFITLIRERLEFLAERDTP